MTFCKTMLAGALAALLSVSAARAQVAVHATVTGQRIGGITCPVTVAPCANNNGEVKPFGGDFGAYYDFRDLGPARIGLDLRGETLVANKRGDTGAGGGKIDRHYSVLGGVRGSFTVRRIPVLHPYVELLGGLDRNNDTGLYTSTVTTQTYTPVQPTTTTTVNSYNPNLYANYGVVKGVAGLDVRLGSFIDLRAIEFGFGEMFGSATNSQTVNVAINNVTTFVGTIPTTVSTVTSTTTTKNSSGPSTHGIQTIGIGVVFHFGPR